MKVLTKTICMLLYSCLKLVDRAKAFIENEFPSQLPKKFATHCTLEYKPKQAVREHRFTELTIIGRLTTEKVDVLVCDFRTYKEMGGKKKIPHITLACADGCFPAMADRELDERFTEINWYAAHDQIPVMTEAVNVYARSVKQMNKHLTKAAI